jgi:sugar lactone lactonase YvrE
MKGNKHMETVTKFIHLTFALQSAPGMTGRIFRRVIALGAVIVSCSSASAQNLFMSDGYSGLAHNLGHIYKIGPNGAPSTFASGLNGPLGLAFDKTGNLFVASFGVGGEILKYSPGRVHSVFASGLSGPEGLAFDGAGNLFVTDSSSGSIYKFTPSGVRATVASGLDGPSGLAFDSSGNLFVASRGAILEFAPGGVR